MCYISLIMFCHYQNQYDEMVKEKDAELEETKNNQKEALAQRSLLVLKYIFYFDIRK